MSGESAVGVSVVMTFLNGRRFIGEAIESVINQSYEDWELFLVDDGSTDGATEIALEFARNHRGKICYLEHQGHTNLGQSISRNAAIARSRARYVAILDADDIYLPEKLERQVAILDRLPEVGMTYGPYFFWHQWIGNRPDAPADQVCCIGTGREYETVTAAPVMLVCMEMGCLFLLAC